MIDLIIKITLWAVLYGAACFGFGIWVGKTFKQTTEEPEDLLEWPPYREQRP